MNAHALFNQNRVVNNKIQLCCPGIAVGAAYNTKSTKSDISGHCLLPPGFRRVVDARRNRVSWALRVASSPCATESRDCRHTIVDGDAKSCGDGVSWTLGVASSSSAISSTTVARGAEEPRRRPPSILRAGAAAARRLEAAAREGRADDSNPSQASALPAQSPTRSSPECFPHGPLCSSKAAPAGPSDRRRRLSRARGIGPAGPWSLLARTEKTWTRDAIATAAPAANSLESAGYPPWMAEARRGAEPRLAPRTSRRNERLGTSAPRLLGAAGLARSTLTQQAGYPDATSRSHKRKTLSSCSLLWILTSTLLHKIQLIVLREIQEAHPSLAVVKSTIL